MEPFGHVNLGFSAKELRKFCEKEMECEPVLMDGTDLMRVLFEQL